MKKLRFPKGVKRINFAMFPEICGESSKAIERIMSYTSIPKSVKRIGYERVITFGEYPSDVTCVYIEK